jgi:Pyridoxamine 5'-phosphate oxidase
MAIERSLEPIEAVRLASLAGELLGASTLCAIATVSPGCRAYVNTAYFAWSDGFDLVWLSEPHAKHSSNVRARGTVAVAVYDSSQWWGKPDRGIQLFGTAREVMGPRPATPSAPTRSVSRATASRSPPPTASTAFARAA